MKMPEPSFSVDVDVTNPGQFFACCGLLELAHRLSPSVGVEGWFSDEGFCVVAPRYEDGIFQLIHDSLRDTDPTEIKTRGDAAMHPIRLKAVGITLDWWIDGRGKKTALKLWAGQQTSLKIIRDLSSAFCDLKLDSPERLFDRASPMTGRFGIDPRAAWNTLGVGFSPNEQQMQVATFPSVELMGAVGLQRFRPVRGDSGSLCYAVWSARLPASIAPAAAAGLLPAGRVRRYRFQIIVRGSYKGFNHAIPEGGNNR